MRAPLAAAVAGGLGLAWPGPGVAGEGISMGGGELPDAVEFHVSQLVDSEVHGAIRERWAQLGWERSYLG